MSFIKVEINPIKRVMELTEGHDYALLVEPFLLQEIGKRVDMSKRELAELLSTVLRELKWVVDYVCEEYDTPIWRLTLVPPFDVRKDLVAKRIAVVGVELYTHIVCVLFSLIAIFGHGWGNHLNWLNRFVEQCDLKGIQLWGEHKDQMLEGTYKWA